MAILVTGGAGYIGSHTCIELMNEGHDVVVVDNLSNSTLESLRRVEQITGKRVKFYQVDLLDKEGLIQVFEMEQIESVIHFAALKAVGESVHQPLRYYKNNITGTLVLCEVMTEFGVKNMVFSSSATVYGDPHKVPIQEDFPLSVTNPYGRTKLMVEDILRDIYRADSEWNIVILRYFNPIGAHKSGFIGEDPKGVPNNIAPYITQVASGKLPVLGVFGNDYPTTDGTGVRDFIHVVDLAMGHVKAIEKIKTSLGVCTYNLGTGKGYSVLQLIRAFEKASQKEIPYVLKERRPGDIATCYADPTYANQELGWSAIRELDEMCEDAWRWQSNNPNGYQ